MPESSSSVNRGNPTRVVVDLDAIAHNLGVVRRYAGETQSVIAVVKSDAYGLGAVPVARRLSAEGVEYLAVSRLEEAVDLRDAGIKIPILLLGALTEAEIPTALARDMTVSLASLSFAERLHRTAMDTQKVIRVHCNIDTGMGRLGLDPDTAADQLAQLVRFSTIDIEGVYTHLVQAHIPRDSFTVEQIKRFRSILKQIDKIGIPYEMTHAANSAGVLNYPDSKLHAVRPGILLYGVLPDIAMDRPENLHEVVRLESRVVFLKQVAAGTSIGYGRTYIAPSPTTVATVPVGYTDGLPYSLSNTGSVLVRGRRCPIIGTVTMDHIMVDVGSVPEVAIDDVVTVIGTDGDETIRVEDIASAAANTIPYAVLTGISPRLPHTYLGETETRAES